MLQRLFRGQTDAAGAITTATDTLDAAIEDAQTERDALQAQYDALQKQISELWSQADAIGSQMYELDQAIGDAAGEIGDSGVTVQVYSRGSSARRAEGDEDIRRQLEELNRQKGDVIRQMDEIKEKYGTEYVDELQAALDKLEALWEQIDDFDERMGDLFAEAPDIDESDFENY